MTHFCIYFLLNTEINPIGAHRNKKQTTAFDIMGIDLLEDQKENIFRFLLAIRPGESCVMEQ